METRDCHYWGVPARLRRRQPFGGTVGVSVQDYVEIRIKIDGGKVGGRKEQMVRMRRTWVMTKQCAKLVPRLVNAERVSSMDRGARRLLLSRGFYSAQILISITYGKALPPAL